MRIYRKTEGRQLEQIRCNCCGKNLKMQGQTAAEGMCRVEVTWGYFSEKDGEHHMFDLCEECYDRITGAFAVPVEKEEEAEIL